MFDRFGFAATVPSSKQRSAVANEKYRVDLLIHICGATLEALHRIENSILGLHPPVPGSRNSEVVIPTQTVIIGCLACDGDEDFPRAIGSVTGVVEPALAAALALSETKPSIRINESATAITATIRSRVRETFRSVRYPSLRSELPPIKLF